MNLSMVSQVFVLRPFWQQINLDYTNTQLQTQRMGSLILILIGNPDVDKIGDCIFVLSYKATRN